MHTDAVLKIRRDTKRKTRVKLKKLKHVGLNDSYSYMVKIMLSLVKIDMNYDGITHWVCGCVYMCMSMLACTRASRWVSVCACACLLV